MTFMEASMLLEFGERPFFLKLVQTNCQLVGNLFGYMIQLLLGVCAFSALIVKKMTDRQQRTWKHWARDTSKQALGSAVVHFSNLAISYYLLDAADYTDPCVFYLMSFLVDAIAGSILMIALVKLIEYLDYKYWRTNRLQSGFYGRPPLFSTWAIQSTVWVIITCLVKAFLLWGVLIPAENPLYLAGEWLMSPFKWHPKWELVMVMIVIPLVMNALVFWNTDAWIMNSQHVPEYSNVDESSDEFPCCLRTPTMDSPIKPDPAANNDSNPQLIVPSDLDSSASSPIPIVSSTASTPTDTPPSSSSSSPAPVSSSLTGASPEGVLRGGSGSSAHFFAPSRKEYRNVSHSAPSSSSSGTTKKSSNKGSSKGKDKSGTAAQKLRSEDYHRL